MVDIIQRATRLPEATSNDIRFLNELLKTLSFNFNVIEERIGVINHEEFNFKTVSSSSYDVELTDFVILCDTTSNAMTLDLPPALNKQGGIYKIKRIVSNSNLVTINTNGSETIDNSSSITLPISTYDKVTLLSDGDNWWTI